MKKEELYEKRQEAKKKKGTLPSSRKVSRE